MLRGTDRIYALVDGFYVTLTVYFIVGENEFVTVIVFPMEWGNSGGLYESSDECDVVTLSNIRNIANVRCGYG